MDHLTMGERIKMLRIQNNLTLEQVGQKVGVGKSTVRKWETGMIANMKRDKIYALAEALHTTPSFLMGWEDSEANEVASENNAIINKQNFYNLDFEGETLFSTNNLYSTKDWMIIRKKIAENIRLYRKKANWTQLQLAEKIDMSQTIISNWENSMLSIEAENLLYICQALSITPNEIYGLEKVDLLSDEVSKEKIFSDHERAIISAYRSQPEMQGAVDRLLGVEREGADIAEDMIKTVRAGALVKKPTDTK